MRDRAGGAVGDGQVLDCDGVPVFESAVADPPAARFQRRQIASTASIVPMLRFVSR